MPIFSLRILARIAGVAQCIAAFLPAIRIRLFGTVSFVRLHSVGGILLTLGAVIAIMAMRARSRWIAAASGVSLLLSVGMYVRIVTAPSGTFADPLLRRAVHPAWGFVPMFVTVLVGVVASVGLLLSERTVVQKQQPE